MRTDEELMLAYVQGDQAAFRELFSRFAPLVLRVLARHLSNASEAQDLTQQTFLQLHRARYDFRTGMRLRPWVMTIAMNLARDVLRRRGRRPETMVEDEIIVDPRATPAMASESADTARRVRAALAQLPRDQREVIELHWFAELSFNEIAETVGATPVAVRVRAHRGYESLRRSLAGVE